MSIYKGVFNISTDRMLVLGDIHGDLDLLLNSLLIGKVIKQVYDKENTIELVYKTEKVPRKYIWTGGNTILVQVGDQIDRCRPTTTNQCINEDATFEDEASDLRIMKFMTDLAKTAKKVGGRVINLLGNHEIMNVRGEEHDYDYVSYEGLKEFTPPKKKVNKIFRQTQFKRGSVIARYLAKTRFTIVYLNGYIFAHAGLIDALLKNKEFINLDLKELINTINKEVICWLKYPTYSSSKVEYILNNLESPLWVRTLGSIPPSLPIDDDKCRDINEIIKKFGIKGMCIGHTPQLIHGASINGTCSNKLFRVDVASSKAFNTVLDNTKNELRKNQILEIKDDKYKVLK